MRRRFRVSRARCRVPGARCPVLGAWCPVPGARAVFVWRPSKHPQTFLTCRKQYTFGAGCLGAWVLAILLKEKKDFLFLFKSARTQAPATKNSVLPNRSFKNRVLMGCLLRCLRDELCKKVDFAEGVSLKTGACVTQIASYSVSVRM